VERVVQQGLEGRQAALGVMVLQMEGMVQILAEEMEEMAGVTERQVEEVVALERMRELEEPKLLLEARVEMEDLAAAAAAAEVDGVARMLDFQPVVVAEVAMPVVAVEALELIVVLAVAAVAAVAAITQTPP
jgi:hypothetical protein